MEDRHRGVLSPLTGAPRGLQGKPGTFAIPWGGRAITWAGAVGLVHLTDISWSGLFRETMITWRSAEVTVHDVAPQLPDRHPVVGVIPTRPRMAAETSALLGLPKPMVQSSERYAERFLESVFTPAPETEGPTE